MDSLPRARIILLSKWKSAEGYGFVLKEEKVKGAHRIKEVGGDSPAEAAGIMENDCLVEVNGKLTSKKLSLNQHIIISCRIHDLQ